MLALDLGSSSVRAVVLDAKLRTVALARRPARLRQDAAGAAELDPERYLAAVTACLDELAADGQLRGVELVAVSCQWHSLVPLDGHGNPAGPALSWLDTRPAVDAGPVPADPGRFHARTGAWWHPFYWPLRIRWLRAQGAAARRFVGLPEYVTGRLLGTTDASISSASGTGALDTVSCVWDAEALALAGVDERAVPALLPDGWRGRLGPEHARRWPDLADAAWAAPLGDGAASALGSGCTGRDRLSVTVGTSAAARLVCPGAPDPFAGVWRYRLDRSRSLLGVAFSAGGMLHDWLAGMVGPVPEAALRGLEPGGHGLVALPFEAGYRPPLPAGGVGSLHGLRLSTRPADVVAATWEGVCHELADGARAVDYGRTAVVVLGGGAVAASPWLARRLAAAFGGFALRCRDGEVGARGAAADALGVACVPDIEEIRVPPGEVAAMTTAADRHRALRHRLATWT